MAGAWKSSDGGTIHKVGTSFFAGAGAATLVSAGANVRGVIIWSYCTDASTEGWIAAGGNEIWRAVTWRGFAAPYPVFVPAGLAITVGGAGHTTRVSYEIL